MFEVRCVRASDSFENMEQTEGSLEASPVAQNVAVVDYNAFSNYLKKVVTVLLEESDDVPPAFTSALEEKDHAECIRKYLGDQQVRALFIQRNSSKGKLLTPLHLTIYSVRVII